MKILLCAGTRPNIVKIAPLYHAARRGNVEVKILYTGQHYDYLMNGIFFEQLKVPAPDINLGISTGTRKELISRIAEETEKYLKQNAFDFVITVGDVNSTLGCSLGAVNAGVPVAHVESGLRSHDKRMPEDANRVETDKIVDYLFISEPDGIKNLKIEKIYNKASCFFVGNVMVDSLVSNLDAIDNVKLPETLKFAPQSYCLVTLHRPSNVNQKLRLKGILKFLQHTSLSLPVIFPLHPRTKASIERYGYQQYTKGITMVEPLGYFEFLHLEKNSKLLITDSGGAQEESTIFGVPCITMRANTERPITLLKGTSLLAGEDLRLATYYTRLVLEGKLNKQVKLKYWDGLASERIIAILQSLQEM